MYRCLSCRLILLLREYSSDGLLTTRMIEPSGGPLEFHHTDVPVSEDQLASVLDSRGGIVD
jgi:hypothetical protein